MKQVLTILSLVVLLATNGLQAADKHAGHGDANKEYTLAELAKYDGKNGNRAYIAVDGVVYDVTDNKEWKNGEHTPTQGRLKAGIDGTEVIAKSPHGKEVLKKLPIVGKLKK